MQMRPDVNFAGYAAGALRHRQAGLGGELEIARAGTIDTFCVRWMIRVAPVALACI